MLKKRKILITFAIILTFAIIGVIIYALMYHGTVQYDEMFLTKIDGCTTCYYLSKAPKNIKFKVETDDGVAPNCQVMKEDGSLAKSKIVKSGNNTYYIAPPESNYQEGETYRLFLPSGIRFSDENLLYARELVFRIDRQACETYEFAENVVEISEPINDVGNGIIRLDGISVHVDQIVYGTNLAGDSVVYRIDKILEDGSLEVSIPTIDEIFSKLDIYGTYHFDVNYLTANPDLEIEILENVKSSEFYLNLLDIAYADEEIKKPSAGVTVKLKPDEKNNTVTVDIEITLTPGEKGLFGVEQLKHHEVALSLTFVIKADASPNIQEDNFEISYSVTSDFRWSIDFRYKSTKTAKELKNLFDTNIHADGDSDYIRTEYPQIVKDIAKALDACEEDVLSGNLKLFEWNVPFPSTPFLTVGVEVSTFVKFNVAALITVEQHGTLTYTTGLRKLDGELRSFSNFNNTKEPVTVSLRGRAGVKAGAKLKFSAELINEYVGYVYVEPEAGAYVDIFATIPILNVNTENEDRFIYSYLEPGFYYSVGFHAYLNYLVDQLDINTELAGEKFPIEEWTLGSKEIALGISSSESVIKAVYNTAVLPRITLEYYDITKWEYKTKRLNWSDLELTTSDGTELQQALGILTVPDDIKSESITVTATYRYNNGTTHSTNFTIQLSGGTLEGKVSAITGDASTAGLASAEVALYPIIGSSPISSQTTDDDGKFSFLVEPGVYRLVVSKAGYQSETLYRTVSDSKTTYVEVTLQANETNPTEPEPTDPKPSEPQPTEPKPTEPLPCRHTETKVANQKDATCTSKGYTGDTVCADCGDIVTNGTTTDALEHQYTSVVVEPTQTSEGYTQHTCQLCGYSYKNNYTDKLPSDATEPSNPEVVFENVYETVYTTRGVNVRSGPSSDYEKVGYLNKGSSAIRTGIGNNGWSRIVFNGSVAYVYSDYLTTTKPAVESQFPGIKFYEFNQPMWAEGRVYIRNGPGLEYDIVGILEEDEQVIMTGCTSDTGDGWREWCRIVRGENVAYILSNYITQYPPMQYYTPVDETVFIIEKTSLNRFPAFAGSLGTLRIGDSIHRIGIGENGWSLINNGGTVAYVYTAYVSTEAPDPKDYELPPVTMWFEETNVPIYAKEPVPVYFMPSKDSDIMTILLYGEMVIQTGVNDDWHRIEIDGKTGYVLAWEEQTQLIAPGPGQGLQHVTVVVKFMSYEPVIIYTYTDGTTGYEPKDGATYVNERGLTVTYQTPRDEAGRPRGEFCEVCNEVISSTNVYGRCSWKPTADFCDDCGLLVEAYSCHDCADLKNNATICSACGFPDGIGIGKCTRFLGDGEHTCHNCGETVPGWTCHTCGVEFEPHWAECPSDLSAEHAEDIVCAIYSFINRDSLAEKNAKLISVYAMTLSGDSRIRSESQCVAVFIFSTQPDNSSDLTYHVGLATNIHLQTPSHISQIAGRWSSAAYSSEDEALAKYLSDGTSILKLFDCSAGKVSVQHQCTSMSFYNESVCLTFDFLNRRKSLGCRPVRAAIR